MSFEASIQAPDINGMNFKAWSTYDGLLVDIEEVEMVSGQPIRSRLYGFECPMGKAQAEGQIPTSGAVFGYVISGMVIIHDDKLPDCSVKLPAAHWFALPGSVHLHLQENTRVVVMQRVGFRGLRAFGGPLEDTGRLKYIDGCSDTLLMGPPLLGDPCLNHLHFPPLIKQTAHTHPSIRAGAIARGYGKCDTPDGTWELYKGVIFYIPTGCSHRFVTEDNSMDVIAYHPDSDWGPTDQDHPMINRTWVDGKKIDNTHQ